MSKSLQGMKKLGMCPSVDPTNTRLLVCNKHCPVFQEHEDSGIGFCPRGPHPFITVVGQLCRPWVEMSMLEAAYLYIHYDREARKEDSRIESPRDVLRKAEGPDLKVVD